MNVLPSSLRLYLTKFVALSPFLVTIFMSRTSELPSQYIRVRDDTWSIDLVTDGKHEVVEHNSYYTGLPVEVGRYFP